MVKVLSSETTTNFYRTTRRHAPPLHGYPLTTSYRVLIQKTFQIHVLMYWEQNSSVNALTVLQAGRPGNRGSICYRGRSYSHLCSIQDGSGGRLSRLSSGYQCFIPRGEGNSGAMVTTYLHLVVTSRKHGAISPRQHLHGFVLN
jgi:hypothetical protein